MSGKRLLPLAGLLIVLIIAAVLLKRQPAPTKLADEVGFERLVPSELHADRISGLDLYQGAKPEDVLRLRRQDSTWVVASHYDAPVQADKIKRLLDTLSTLEGELRSDKAELLGDFRLETAQALHLQIYTEDVKTPAVHLLAGKGRGRHGFMRIADDNRVYSVNLNLYNEAGLYGSNTDQPPEAKPWMDLQIQNIPREQITAVALRTPTQRWRFIRQQPSESSTEAPQTASTTESPWTLAEPDVKYAVKQGYLNGLISTLRTLRAEDIADPANIAEYGLTDAPYRATLTVQPEKGQDTRQVTLWIGHEVPQQAGKHYARLGQEGPVYILPQWSFNRLFPKGKELLDLPGLKLKEADIQQIAFLTPTRTVRLTRSAGTPTAAKDNQKTPAWTLAHPSTTTVTVRQDSIGTLVRRLATFTPDDLAPTDSSVPPPSSMGLSKVEITTRDASRHLLRFGPPLTEHPQQYSLYLNDQPTPFVIDKNTRDNLLPPLRTLLDLRIIRSQPQEVTRLTWQHNGQAWSLERRPPISPAAAEAQTTSGWQLLEVPQATVDTQAVESLLTTITHLAADDWLEHPSQQASFEPPTLTLSLTLRDGRTTHLALGADDHSSYLRVEGTPGFFVMPTAIYNTLVKTLTALRPSDTSSISTMSPTQ
jgi:hypothetical protein